MTAKAPSARPLSATNEWINITGLLGAIAVMVVCVRHGMRGVEAALLIAGAYAAAIIVLEVLFLKTPRNASTGLDFDRRDIDWPRVAVKLLGLYGSYGFVALLYWLFPEYHGSYYTPFWEALRLVGPWLLVLSAPYLIYVDQRMTEPRDSYYWFGKCLLLQGRGANRTQMAQHLLGWIVKGFFLPLMFVSFVGNITFLAGVDFADKTESFKAFFDVATSILFTIDLLAAVVGYAVAIRLFDTHIRSSEPTVFGWLICLMCYQPFLSVYMRFYLSYGSNDWYVALAGHPTLQVVWGTTALVLLAGYTWASINFGCRFSNITHRGVLTKGMYRFTKHPAYVCKNTYWWMQYVPFVPMGGWLESLRFSLLILGINAVYFLRARTEESHLSRDPKYVEYALYMNERSVFAPLTRCLPFLRYKAPANWQNLPRPYQGIK